jgi:hypothetical protein
VNTIVLRELLRFKALSLSLKVRGCVFINISKTIEAYRSSNKGNHIKKCSKDSGKTIAIADKWVACLVHGLSVAKVLLVLTFCNFL